MIMFKKKCPHCNEKISKANSFCPFCGANLKKQTEKEDYGFLGRNDSEDFTPEPRLSPVESMIDKMMNSAMKMMAKQMQGIQKDINPQMRNLPTSPNSNVRVQLYVNGKKVNPPNQQQPQKQVFQKKEIKQPTLSKDKAEKFSKLPKKEAKSKMRRFANKLVYEISIPGVKAIEDVLINQLENSIEIKALAKDKVYKKTLQVNLPIIGYGLKQGNLILELQAR